MYNENNCRSGKINSGCGSHGGKFGGYHGGTRFAKHSHQTFRHDLRRVATNIEENDESFIIQLFAPALLKENLKVVTKDDILIISYSPKEGEEFLTKFTRREYSNGAFERAFALNGKVLSENILANYADGILKITLPKNPETNIPAKDIAVN